MSIEYAPVTGPPFARRAGYLAFAIGRMLGASRADVVITRDLGVASALLRVPRRLRPPVVYESHGYAPDVAAALPGMIPAANAPSATKVARLERREAFVWRNAEGYVTITAGLADDLKQRLGERGTLAVVPDGTRIDADPGTGRGSDERASWSGRLRRSSVCVERRRRPARCAGTAWRGPRGDRGRLRERARPRPAARASGAARHLGSGHVHGTRATVGCRGVSSGGAGARAAESRVCHLDAVHVAIEAVRVHGRRPADRRIRPAVDPRGAASRGECAARRAWQSNGACGRCETIARGSARSPIVWRRPR